MNLLLSIADKRMRSDSGERSSRVQVCTSDSHRLDGWRKSAGTYSLSYELVSAATRELII
ncbi:hypothetical protein D8674_004572 [Pyrus ussuriensis x Pyrus communis]|uniref:Uncharacterized protein n=1 Tax=Pyrus ussuriensis x Pyrus communis TaxID=2448454 RepID=A0A5N5FL31_9ROSA|nr:hypothetical protein D8674_004572 [Pyrus ussuriensis x Pyrus communis]